MSTFSRNCQRRRGEMGASPSTRFVQPVFSSVGIRLPVLQKSCARWHGQLDGRVANREHFRVRFVCKHESCRSPNSTHRLTGEFSIEIVSVKSSLETDPLSSAEHVATGVARPIDALQTAASSAQDLLSADQLAAFHRDGFVVLRQWVPADVVARMLSVTQRDLAARIEPLEFEADVRYRGSPESRQSPGGDTIRRLKSAVVRDPVFADWVSRRDVVGPLQQILGGRVVLPWAHHNCVMTKQPRFSSETMWHQDIRYWSYTRPELVSAWIALGEERIENGCLWVIPGSHAMTFDRAQFDDALFFRTDLPENAALLQTRTAVLLQPGDLLLFHCRVFHAAGRNETSHSKLAAVFTFRPWDNPPLPGSRSAAAPELLLPEV